MAAILTIDDVRNVIETGASDHQIQMLINFVDQADACLDAAGVPCETQLLLKSYAVAHLLTMQSGGQVKSERDMDGASVSYSVPQGGYGLSATNYGQMILSMVGSDCIEDLIDKPQRFAGAIGR